MRNPVRANRVHTKNEKMLLLVLIIAVFSSFLYSFAVNMTGKEMYIGRISNLLKIPAI